MSKESYILRTKRRENFTIISNEIFRSKMSLRAIGLLCYLVHLPDDWKVIRNELHNNFKDGRDATAKAFNELISAGYVMESKIRKKGKFGQTVYYVFDTPQTDFQYTAENEAAEPEKPQTEKPYTVKPDTEKPYTENPQLLNTNELSTDLEKELRDKTLSVNSSELTGAASFEVSKEELVAPLDLIPPVAPPPLKQKKTVFQRVVDCYYEWFKTRNDNVPPKIDGVEVKAAKSLAVYLKSVVKAKKLTFLPEELDDKAIEAFELILSEWGNLEPFIQKQTKLMQINSNITNIINSLRNGYKQTATEEKRDRANTINTGFAAIDAAFKR